MAENILPVLKRGSIVVYPAHGIGIVEKIEKVKTNGTTKSYYTIRIDDAGMTIKVPAKRACEIGVRAVIKDREVLKVLKIFKSKSKIKNGMNWHKRQKSYIDRIKSGSVFELAEILRELKHIQIKKELSFGEQRMHDNVLQLIVMEIAQAKGIEKEQANKLLDKAFHSQPNI